jgi:hypothetical protein
VGQLSQADAGAELDFDDELDVEAALLHERDDPAAPQQPIAAEEARHAWQETNKGLARQDKNETPLVDVEDSQKLQRPDTSSDLTASPRRDSRPTSHTALAPARVIAPAEAVQMCSKLREAIARRHKQQQRYDALCAATLTRRAAQASVVDV